MQGRIPLKVPGLDIGLLEIRSMDRVDLSPQADYEDLWNRPDQVRSLTPCGVALIPLTLLGLAIPCYIRERTLLGLRRP